VDFHGSRVKQAIQQLLLKRRFFHAFQLAGRIGAVVRGQRRTRSDSCATSHQECERNPKVS
jgi:hypothetical protein